MYKRLKKLYEDGRLRKTGMKNAVKKGWITEAEYEEITGEAYGES